MKRAVPRSRMPTTSGSAQSSPPGSGNSKNPSRPSSGRSTSSNQSSVKSAPPGAQSPSFNIDRHTPNSPHTPGSGHGRKNSATGGGSSGNNSSSGTIYSRTTNPPSYAQALRYGTVASPTSTGLSSHGSSGQGRPCRSQSDPIHMLAAANKHLARHGQGLNSSALGNLGGGIASMYSSPQGYDSRGGIDVSAQNNGGNDSNSSSQGSAGSGLPPMVLGSGNGNGRLGTSNVALSPGIIGKVRSDSDASQWSFSLPSARGTFGDQELDGVSELDGAESDSDTALGMTWVPSSVSLDSGSSQQQHQSTNSSFNFSGGLTAIPEGSVLPLSIQHMQQHQQHMQQHMQQHQQHIQHIMQDGGTTGTSYRISEPASFQESYNYTSPNSSPMQPASQQHALFQQQHQLHLQQQQQQQQQLQQHQLQQQQQQQLQFFQQQQQHHQQLMQEQQQMQLQLQMHFPSPTRNYPLYSEESSPFESFSPSSGPGSTSARWAPLSPQLPMHSSSLLGNSPNDNRLQMPGPFPDSGHETMPVGGMMSQPLSSGNNSLYSFLPAHSVTSGSILSNHIQPSASYVHNASSVHQGSDTLGDGNNNDNLYDIRLNAGYDFGGPMTSAWNNMGTLS